MRSYLTVAVLAVLCVAAFTETASAQLFRRVWQRRKAELRSELSYQLSGQVAGNVNAAEARLSADLDAKLAEQGKVLEGQVEAGDFRGLGHGLPDRAQSRIGRVVQQFTGRSGPSSPGVSRSAVRPVERLSYPPDWSTHMGLAQ